MFRVVLGANVASGDAVRDDDQLRSLDGENPGALRERQVVADIDADLPAVDIDERKFGAVPEVDLLHGSQSGGVRLAVLLDDLAIRVDHHRRVVVQPG